ncbi:sugar transferase [Candidatus Allofournierella merdipullorum]|uniref:sugar transferase n=1 Tax=Candidatus Allofournierella merdipullorum TaxID=2838595 RepID=UPI002A8B125D|nr:sugar transferase [Candidatus Fournierella merdipullorum]
MIRRHQGLLNMANFLLDTGLVFASYLLAVWLRQGVLTDAVLTMQELLQLHYILGALLYACVMGVAYVALRLYGSFRFQRFWQEAATLAVANAVGTLAIGTGLYLFRLTDFSRLTLLLLYLISTVLVILKRVMLRGILEHYRSLGYNTRTLLVVGGGEHACGYMQHIRDNPQYGYRLLGYIATSPAEKTNEAYLGGYEEFHKRVSTRAVDHVVFCMRHTETATMGAMIAACGRYGAKASVIPDYNEFIPSRPTVELAGEYKLVNVRSTPDKGPVWTFIKRSMDVVGAAIGLMLASPIMLVTAIAVKRCDGGPVIFAQERVGKDGRHFKMYKFRSMYRDAEARLAELQKYNQVDGPAFKMVNDPRITPVGKFIRKTSIDELPQLLNILKGEMSIVGPRPPLPREVAQYSDWDWGRLAVKPGLTCYWQVSGRSDVSFDEWMRLDLKYVEEQGLWTDLKILFKTVAVVLRGDGAY